jgi:hypothetical protein
VIPIAGLVKPITDMIGELHTSGEERGKLQLALAGLQVGYAQQVLGYELQIQQMQADVIKSEAAGASWIQRSWRPITMLVFVALVVLDTVGLVANRLAPEAWTLLQLGLGGYVVGRSFEKIAPQVTAAIATAKATGEKEKKR